MLAWMAGAFRDASATLERAALLEQENAELRDELAAARQEIARLRDATLPAENRDAFVRRLQEERNDLLAEVRSLREEIAAARARARRQLVVDRWYKPQPEPAPDASRGPNLASLLARRLSTWLGGR